MEYEGQICRPPMEKSSFMLPVAVGCSYNRCTFCTLFKHLSYRQLPLEQVEAEIKRVHQAGGNPKQIFLGDGNAFGLETSHLLSILSLIHRYFPGCEMVNMDATVTNIHNKSDEELKLLYREGVRRLYLGIESGLDDVLASTKKDHTLEQAYREIERMQNAGLIFNAHIMTGIAGKDRVHRCTRSFPAMPVMMCALKISPAFCIRSISRYACSSVWSFLVEARTSSKPLSMPKYSRRTPSRYNSFNSSSDLLWMLVTVASMLTISQPGK